MTRRQVVAAVLAVLLAIGGVASLVRYTNGAEARAFAGTEMTPVVRVVSSVPAGTPAAEVAQAVEVVELPATSVVPGAMTSVSDLTEMADRETTTVLEPGEQLMPSRLAAPVVEQEAPTDVPAGMLELSIPLDVAGSVGGSVKPGDVVGVLASYGNQGNADGRTGFALQGVRITGASGGVAGTADGEQVDGMVVTLAVSGADATRIQHASRFGYVTLTKQNDATKTGEPQTMTTKEVLP